MKSKLLISYAFFIFTSLSAFSQNNFELPENIELKAAEDYARYESDIIKAAKWLEETDLDKETEKRKKISQFVVQWLTGSPNVSIELNEPLMDIFEDNPSFMVIYFASASKYILENQGTASKLNAAKAGLLSVLKVYQKKIGIKENKAIKKLNGAYEKNNLDQYISEKIIK